MADADFNVKAIISAQTSQFEKGMKNAQSSVSSLSNSISNITNLVKKAFAFTGVAVGTKAILDFGKSCVQSATQAEKQFNILDNTVKATGASAWTSIGELENASKALSDSTNYSVTEIQNMQSVLLGFTNITGEAFDEASEAVLDMATVMGMDLTSAVQTIGKALDDPVSGLDSLRRQGFKFTDEQKAELGQLVKNGNQLEAQKIILDSLSMSYGGAAKAGQDAFAKQRHALENFQDTLGTKLIPIMQVFAKNSADVLNKLTDLVSKIDFTPIVNVLSNLSEKFKSVFENNIKNYLIEAGNQVKDFISRFNFQPIISIIDTLVGAITSMFSTIKNQSSGTSNIFKEIKEGLISISNSEIFQNIVNFINKLIDGVYFIWEQIQEVSSEIRNLVVGKIIEIWNKIKELFTNSQNALAESGQDITSWGDFFWKILDNVFRIFQDLINGVKAILQGDWSVAWEYAKLAVLRVGDQILTIISTIANAFPNAINGMIKALNSLIEGINSVRGFFGQDPLGLIEAFESVDLSKSTGLDKKIEETENKIQELTGKTADIAIKDLNGISTKFSGFTFSALGNIKDLTDDIATETDKQKTYFNSVTSSGENSYKKFSEWDSKLLEQRLESLNDWSSEAHQINLQLIEEERKKALESDKSGAETEKINKYYNKKIEQENKRSMQARLNLVKQTISKVTSFVKSMIGTITNVISKGFDMFKSLASVNTSDLLDKLLEFEDNILTFFVETLPTLPSFFASAIQSIMVLLENLLSMIGPEQISEIITSIVNTISENLPTIIDLVTNLIFDIIDALINSMPQIMEALETIVTKLAENFPKFVQKFIDLIIAILQEPDKIANMVVALIQGIVEVVSVLLRNIAPLLKAILPVIGQIIIAVIKAIPDFLYSLGSALWDAIKEIGKFIVNIIIDVLNGMFDTISKAWTWIPGTSGIEHIPHLMNGTNDASRGLTLVGEAGPELVKFNGGEQVLNNHNTQKALKNMGGNTNNFNVTFNNLSDTTAYMMIQQMKQYNREMAINGII